MKQIKITKKVENMYKFTPLEQKYFKHQMQTHRGMTNANCPFCKSYQAKVDKDNKIFAGVRKT